MKLDEKFSSRTCLLLFQTLELLRKEIQPKFSDWKDADDWLFSQLDFSKDELAQIYKNRNVLYYDGSAIDYDDAKLMGARQISIEKFIGRPIFSDEAKAVVDELNVMLGVDALKINEDYITETERDDMIRYIERIIYEYNQEELERQMKDGFHLHMNASVPLDAIKLPVVDTEPKGTGGNDANKPSLKEQVQQADDYKTKLNSSKAKALDIQEQLSQ